MRNQRQAFETQKKEREVKFTDRVPPRERKTFNLGGSGCKAPLLSKIINARLTAKQGGKPAPKTLMQKAIVDSAKIYKGRLESPYKPGNFRPTNLKNHRVTKPAPVPLLPPSSAYSSRVSVSTVRTPKYPAHTASSVSTSPSASSSAETSPTLPIASPTSHHHAGPFPPSISPAKRKPEDPTPSLSCKMTVERQQTAVPPRPVKRQKKDPMSALFLPKDRAYSQRPTTAR